MWLALALAVHASSPIAVSGSASELDRAEAVQFLDALRGALRRDTGRAVVVDDVLAPCEDDACVGALRDRLGTSEVVTVALVAVGGRVRAHAQRHAADPAESRPVQLTAPRAALLGAATSLARLLYGAAEATPALDAPRDPAAPPDGTAPRDGAAPAPSSGARVVAWSAVGAGAAAAAVAVALRVSAESARDTLATTALDPAALEDARSRALGHGAASNVAWVASAALLSGALVYLLTTP